MGFLSHWTWSRAAIARYLLVIVLLVTSSGTLRAQFPAEIEGTVSDAVSGAPIPYASVQPANGATVETEGKGAFALRGLDPGSFSLVITALGYQPRRLDLVLANGEHRFLAIRLVPSPVMLPELVTTAASSRPGTSVLDRNSIEASGRSDLGGLLEGQPGVSIERRGGPSGPATISIRGSATNQVLVLLDGVPLNDAMTGSADLSLVPLESLDSVVIRRGGESDRYGSRAMGGVVELYQRRSGADAAGVSARGGSWGERGLSGDLAGRTADDRWSGRLSGGVHDVDGDFPFTVPEVRGGGTATRVNAGATQRDAQASAALRTGQSEVQLRGDWLSIDRGMPGTIIQQSETARQAQRRIGGGVNLRVRGSGISWLTDLAVQHQRATFADTAPEFSAPYHDSLTALTLTAQSGVDLGRGPWSFSGGIDLRYLRPRGSALSDSTPRTQTFGGLYLSAAIRSNWSTDGFVQLSAAGRGDAGSGVGSAVLSPKIAASAGRGGWSVSATWSQSFSPPSLGDLFFQEGVQVKANPDLRPERVRDEVSLSAALREQPLLGMGIRGSVLAYRADIDDMVLWTPNFAYIWSPHNFDISRQGIEAEMVDRLPRLNAELGLNAGYNDLTYIGPVFEGQVIYRPHWTGAARLDLDLIGFRIGMAARYTGIRRTGIGSSLNLLPAFVVADIHLSRRLRLGHGSLELSAGVDNLFDQHTTLLIDYPAPGRGWWVGSRIALGRDGRAPESN